MGKLVWWLLDATKEYWLPMVIGSLVTGVTLCVYWYPLSPWAGWRAVCMAVLLGFLATAVGLLYVREKSGVAGRERNERKFLRHALASIDDSERTFIDLFSTKGRNTLDLPITHATVAGMVHKKILLIVGKCPNDSEIMYPMTLNPLIQRYQKRGVIPSPSQINPQTSTPDP
jgi:hypothetical protein